jgi:hypothetical protein
MPQGWVIDQAADTITFDEAPANAAPIVVKETAMAATKATDIWAFGAWGTLYGYPSEVEFYADRLVLAASRAQPQTMWMSKGSAYNDFGRTVPLLDDDAITITINARQVNSIKELVPLSDLIIMTTTGEWKMTTGADGVVAPGKTGFKPQSYYGNSGIASQIVGNTAIFVQGRGNIVRDMSFQFTDDGYTGNDLTIYAGHLVEGYQIVDIAFQQAPYSAVWLVRNDGALISLTYVREQEVVGWALHTTLGKFENVCVVPEGPINAVYVTVRRTIDGVERVFVERLHDRDLTDPRDAFFVDAGLTYDGRAVAGTQTLSGGVNWDDLEQLTLTGSVSRWTGSDDVGDQVKLRLPSIEVVNGQAVDTFVELRLRIIQYISGTIVRVRAVGDVPVEFRNVAFSNWELLRDRIEGLEHLEGQTVSVLADGNVDGPFVVTDGAIDLTNPAAVVHVGLGYRSLIESLDINVPGQETVRDRPKLINKVTLVVKDTRGLKSGPDLGLLDDFKMREYEDYSESVALATGIMDVNVSNSWDKNGRFVVVQDEPLPATILSLIPQVAIAGVG